MFMKDIGRYWWKLQCNQVYYFKYFFNINSSILLIIKFLKLYFNFTSKLLKYFHAFKRRKKMHVIDPNLSIEEMFIVVVLSCI